MSEMQDNLIINIMEVKIEKFVLVVLGTTLGLSLIIRYYFSYVKSFKR